MKIVYEANDGTQFETEDECVRYEFGMSYEGILPLFANDDIRVWNGKTEKMNLSEFLEKRDVVESFFDNIFYIDFKTEKARSIFEKFANDHDITFDLSYSFPFGSADFYYWDDHQDCWCSFSALKGLVASMEEIRNSPSN